MAGAVEERFQPGHVAPERPAYPAIWCAFRGGKVVVMRISGTPQLPVLRPEELGSAARHSHYLGMLDGVHCYAAHLDEGHALPAGTDLVGLRALILESDELTSGLAGRAFQILEWERTHRYCGACGEPTVAHDVDRARVCSGCRQLYYPRIAPVVMALVTRDREILLTRKPGYAPGRYTVVAGFVEAGETLEHALMREVQEEAGVESGRPRYFGSQPWPFPNSLVMAFSLEYLCGEVRPDGVEIEDARWFDIDALPELPESVHISRHLIDDTVARLRAAQLSSGG
ncbi:MAG TPA: NAD(+) diphosphatase [Burkholderiales bacterium]